MWVGENKFRRVCTRGISEGGEDWAVKLVLLLFRPSRVLPTKEGLEQSEKDRERGERGKFGGGGGIRGGYYW